MAVVAGAGAEVAVAGGVGVLGRPGVRGRWESGGVQGLIGAGGRGAERRGRFVLGGADRGSGRRGPEGNGARISDRRMDLVRL